MLLFIIFLFGTCFASFIVSFSQRLVNQQSLILPWRSCCDNCNKTLYWWQLIPIFSFIYLHGHCYFCKQKISLFLPITEFISGIAFATLIIYDPLHDLLISIFIITLLFLASTDFFTNIIYSFALLGLLPATFLSIPQNYFYNFITALIIAVSLLLFTALTGTLGNGDIEYLFFICIIWGWQQTLLIIQASSVIMLFFFLCTKKQKLPLIPALSLSTLVSLFLQGC